MAGSHGRTDCGFFSKGEGGELLGKELANNEIDCLLNSCLDGGAKWWGLGILVLEPRKCISLAVVGIYCGEKGGMEEFSECLSLGWTDSGGERGRGRKIGL